MPVVFTPYLKERLNIDQPESPDSDRNRPDEVAESTADDSLLTRRQLLTGAVAGVVVALGVLRLRRTSSESTESAETDS